MLMITQQVVTYIKDQLSRGTDRTKIRANLLSAGWVESDINQAFSFAEPGGQSAAVKIAPAFAVEEETKPKTPVDKTEATKSEPVMPILQKDDAKREPSNLSAFAYDNPKPNNPVVSQVATSNPNLVSPAENKPAVSSNPEVSLNNIVKTPISSPAPVSNPVQSVNASPVRNTIETDVVRNFESVSGPAMNATPAKKSSSSVLKIIAGLLFLFLVAGNAYLWLIVLPSMQKSPSEMSTMETNSSNIDQSQRVSNSPVENIVPASNVGTSLSNDLAMPSANLQKAAADYFSRYNSYGGIRMSLGSCNTSGTVFSDAGVKSYVEEISRVTGRIPQCALDSDTSSNRTISYMVYVPMEDGGYCVDSMGASMTLPKAPTGYSCSTGL